MRAVLVCALIFAVAFAAAADETEMEEVSSFVETSSDIAHLQAVGSEGEQEVDAEGFPVPLTKKQRATTMEPRYLGDPIAGPKKYIVPEYAVPKAPKKARKNAPRVFSSHYFSPMPKPRARKCKTKKCRQAWRRAKRKNQPLQSIETYQQHMIKQKGFVQPEIIANYPGGPRGEHLAKQAAKRPKPFGMPKKTLAPAPIVKFLEISAEEAAEAVDTSDEAEEAAAAAEADEASEFSEEELAGREQVTVLSGPEQFYAEGFQAPDWADEEMAEEESVEDADEGEAEEESEVAEDSEEESSDAAEAEEDAEVALLEESDEEESEEEADEESEDEEEADEEADEENEDEADEENEEEADEEADEENEDEAEEETEEVALIEASAEAQEEDEDEDEEEEEESDESEDAEAEAVDELAENEELAEQIDMDASEDEADSDEEVEEEEEAEEEDEDEAQDNEEAETEANEQAVAEMFEVDEHLAGADTLLAEVDAHLVAHHANEGESDAEADSEAEAEAEAKGTPGHAISAGMTWEDAQNAKLDAMEEQLRAERAMSPKVAAKVVSSVAELAQLDEEHQMPEFDSEEGADHAETVAPEMVDA